MSVTSTDRRVFRHAGAAVTEPINRWWQPLLGQLSRIAAGLVLPLALLALWQLAVNKQWMPEQILPAPALVWQSMRELWHSGELQNHLLISATRVGWSLLIGGTTGLLLGLGMGLSRSA